MIEIAILGYGIVGSGVAEVVDMNAAAIRRHTGQHIHVKRILDVRDFPGDPYEDRLTKDAELVFGDPEIRVVVETIGGTRIAYDFTKRALSAGKHVVTSNKELVAAFGPELMDLAHDNGISYLFEASVGGGIPIIRPLHKCLAANEILSIAGILNGTTNYILTRMQQEGVGFDAALREAQEAGYAEKDPTADVEGHDACRKIAILSSIAFDHFVDYRDVRTEGIVALTQTDMAYAASLGTRIKLVASCRRLEDGRLADTPELRRAMHDMIVDSSNDATHYLIDLMTNTTSGPELPEPELKVWFEKRNAVTRYFHGLGYTGVLAHKKPWGDGPYGRESQATKLFDPKRNMLTTDASARLLTEIVTRRCVTPARSAEMMTLLARNPASDAKPADEQAQFTGPALPPGTKLWSKAGWTSQTRHDAAYVELPGGGKVGLVIFTTDHSREPEIIRTAARAVIEAW